jgi:hypothetical protein
VKAFLRILRGELLFGARPQGVTFNNGSEKHQRKHHNILLQSIVDMEEIFSPVASASCISEYLTLGFEK